VDITEITVVMLGNHLSGGAFRPAALLVPLTIFMILVEAVSLAFHRLPVLHLAGQDLETKHNK
jgi:hypothetical protein